jgi:hypothetical protein
MGLALPALAGELLPSAPPRRRPAAADPPRGMVVVLAVLAPW